MGGLLGDRTTNLRVMINPGTATSMRVAAPGRRSKHITRPDAIAPAFLQLLSSDCQDHGRLFQAREMLGL